MTRDEMITIIEDYLILRTEEPDLHTDPREAAEYIVGGCFETFLELNEDFWDTNGKD
jgi:hypothetical protein